MRRIGLVLALALGLIVVPPAGDAQQTGKVYRVGVLVPVASSAATDLLEVLRQGLRELGYVEGRNLAFELRFAQTTALMAESAADLARLNVDVIVASTTMPALAARRATSTIPIVMVASADPVASGLIASLARPGGNVTGSAVLTRELSTKQLQFLKELSPRASRVSVFLNRANPLSAEIWRDLQHAAHELAMTLESVDVRDASTLDGALATAAKHRVDALLVMPEPILFTQYQRIAEFAVKNHQLSISLLREFAVAGGLASYGPSYRHLLARASFFVDKILRGSKPSELPVEQPTRFELVINLKTAKALGLTIPQTLLLRADQVIE